MMIGSLTLQHVGPAPGLELTFSPRLNVLTGDNGLGKTFILDVVWWVLTTTWAGERAFPASPAGGDDALADQASEPRIQAVLAKRGGAPDAEIEVVTGGAWRWASQEWERVRHDEGNRLPRSLVLYARVDNSYAVFDSAYVPGGTASFSDAVILLSPGELWDGKEIPDPGVQGGRRTVINGLIADWVSWQQRARSPEFALLREVIAALSPPGERLNLDLSPTRVHLRDRRDIPVIGTAYGDVPITLASAGMRRALSLAYLLVWAWTEHERAAKTRRELPTRDLVLLIDEPELHQHPAWQRAFLPAVLQAIRSLAPQVSIQTLATTHSPLVLASLEPIFDPRQDALLTFDLLRAERRVVAQKARWRPRGDVSNWLTSEVFDLGYARSREAEKALQEAVEALDAPDLSPERARQIHHKLHASLGDTDPFWARWVAYAQAKGIEP